MYVVPSKTGDYDAYAGLASLDDEKKSGTEDMNGGDAEPEVGEDALSWSHMTIYSGEYGDERAYKYKLGVDSSIIPNFVSALGTKNEEETEAETESGLLKSAYAFDGSFMWEDIYKIMKASGNTEKYGEKEDGTSGNALMLADYIAPYFKGCTFNVRYFVDKNTNLPSKVSGTITNGKWAYLTDYLTAKANIGNDGVFDADFVNVEVEKTTFSAVYDFTKPNIAVPDEAIERAKEAKR